MIQYLSDLFLFSKASQRKEKKELKTRYRTPKTQKEDAKTCIQQDVGVAMVQQ